MTVTTKTTTKQTTTEALAAERAGAHTFALDLREDRLRQRDLAVERVDEIAAAWTRGDDRFTSAESLAASEEHKRSEKLLAAAVQQVKAATRDLINTDRALAEIVAPALRSAYEVDQQIETMANAEVPDIRPLLTILQTKAGSTSLATGHHAGDLDLVYRRGSIHLPLTAERLVKFLEGAGHRVADASGGVSTSNDGSEYIDRTTVTVHQAFPQVPVIEAPATSEAHVKDIGTWLAYEVSGRFVVQNPYGKPSYPVNVDPHATSCKSVSIADGISLAVVALALDFPKIDLGAEAVESQTGQVLDQMIGRTFAGVGRCIATQAQGSRVLTTPGGAFFARSILIEIEFESALPA